MRIYTSIKQYCGKAVYAVTTKCANVVICVYWIGVWGMNLRAFDSWDPWHRCDIIEFREENWSQSWLCRGMHHPDVATGSLQDSLESSLKIWRVEQLEAIEGVVQGECSSRCGHNEISHLGYSCWIGDCKDYPLRRMEMDLATNCWCWLHFYQSLECTCSYI